MTSIVKQCVRALGATAEKFPDHRIILVGHSAGAHLAVCERIRTAGYSWAWLLLPCLPWFLTTWVLCCSQAVLMDWDWRGEERPATGEQIGGTLN